MRGKLALVVERLRGQRRDLLQIAVATGLAWGLAAGVFGFEDPFFAPIAALVVLNGPAQRTRRAVEITVGVAVGIACGDLLVLAIGTGGWQLVLVTVLAVAAVTAAGGGPLVRAQAGIAALLVVVLQPPTESLVPYRFLHALIGGGAGLLVAALLPASPARQLERAAAPAFAALADVLDATATALLHDDQVGARAALARARALDVEVAALRESVDAAAENARIGVGRRRHRGLVGTYTSAVEQLDLAVRNTRVLARATLALQEHPGAAAPPELTDAVRDLADAVRATGAVLRGDGDPDDIRLHAGAAAARTRTLFPDTRSLAISRTVGQIRSTGVDLLRCSGLDVEEAQRALYDAPMPPPRH